MGIDPRFSQILKYPRISNHDDQKENLHQENFRRTVKKMLPKTLLNFLKLFMIIL